MWLCSICSQLFGRGCERLCSTKCGHVYHYVCLMEWWENSATCPDCRECCVADDYIMIYLNSSLGPEKVDEVKRLSEIKNQGVKTLTHIENGVKSLILTKDAQNENHSKTITDDISKLHDIINSIEDVSVTLSELNARAHDMMERHDDIKEPEASLKMLIDFSARLQRDLDCYAKNYRKVQNDSYENSLQNVSLRSENSGLMCDLAITSQRNECLHSAISLLKKEIYEKQSTIKKEIDLKRKLANEIYDLQDKNRELLVQLEAAEANSVPSYNTIKRLNVIIAEKCELLTIHTQRISELNITIEELEKKIEAQNLEMIAKLEEKDQMIAEQKHRLNVCSMQCDQMSDKLSSLERKLFFYEAVVRGVSDRKGEPESPRLHFSISTNTGGSSNELDQSKTEPNLPSKHEKS